MNKTRDSNFELMRIVSMLFIILWHILIHGNFIANTGNKALVNFLNIIMCFLIVHVNSYVLLFGYYQSKSKFKISKLIKIFFQVVFYSLLFLFIAIKMKWIVDYNIVNFIENILPSCISNYWFINSYIIVYIFSDFINMFINRLTKREYKNVLIILFLVLSVMPYLSGMKFLVNNGYNYINFILIYLIGGYIRKYPIKESYHFKNMSLNGYRTFLLFAFFLIAITNFMINYFAYTSDGLSNISSFISGRILSSSNSYSSPLVIIQTIVFFEFFRSISIKSKLINIVSANVFGIYLFHDNVYVRENIYKLLKIDNGIYYGYSHIIYALTGTVIIFMIGWTIEIIRRIIAKVIRRSRLYQKIKKRTINFINSFNFKINI